MGGWVDGIVLLWLERYDKGTTGREECLSRVFLCGLCPCRERKLARRGNDVEKKEI